MNHFFNRICNKIEKFRFSHINILKTLIVNFRAFPFKTAIKIPIYIYGKTRIVFGGITIHGEIVRGMIRIGLKPAKAYGNTRLLGYGQYEFWGEAEIWGGCVIENNGRIKFGDKVALAENCRIMCKSEIDLGNLVHFGFDCIIMDTDFHYVMNINDNSTSINTSSICIGNGTWISSNCKIMKGSRLPADCIVANGCLINKDFSEVKPYHIFVGVPGKPIRQGYRRIYNVEVERNIFKYALEHPNIKCIELSQFQSEYAGTDEFCYKNCLNFYPERKRKECKYGI